MEIPKHLTHKPIIGIDDYEVLGKNKGYYGNDAKALSIGYAQYDSEELSLKVFRNVNGKWSRQSEELPPYRNLDLNIFFVASLLEAMEQELSYSDTDTDILKNRKEIRMDSKTIVKEYYEKHKEYLQPRLKQLKELLEILNP